jgi:vacuolar-type H+-ATPase subunit I/STV1
MIISPDDRTGLLSLSIGTVFLLASNVMGHGIYIQPDPRGALLLAAAGLLFFVVAHSHAQRWRDRFLRVLQFVLALSTFSVVAALFMADLQQFHRMATQDWGATPPPQLIFSVIYALASLVALLGICVNARRGTALASRELATRPR